MSIRNVILGVSSVTVSYLKHASLLQDVTDIIKKCDRFFITKCDSFITKCGLQNVMFIINCNSIMLSLLLLCFEISNGKIFSVSNGKVYKCFSLCYLTFLITISFRKVSWNLQNNKTIIYQLILVDDAFSHCYMRLNRHVKYFLLFYI